LSERRATNKYYPPDWDPSKGSINKFVGQHPLRDRARKLDQGILIVRFELPYNIWCLGCNNHVGMGVRYNAEKKKIGSYYSTPIWQFRMKCHLCSNWIEIHTDPKNSAYVIESGAKAQTTTWDPAENGTVVLQSEEVSEKLKANPLFRLEHQAVDEAKGASAKTQLTQLQESRDKFWRDPYTMSQRLRKIFRVCGPGRCGERQGRRWDDRAL
ncbi:CWC16 protein, partial [Polychytrium aggregatum]|uniref:CWC16 protein n=1 Tax=Polychytrium aggregatum TaxID=110093 RepID=UPI0022FDB337